MRNRALWITIGVLAIIFLLVADASAQSTTYKIYGYVRVDGNLMNGVTVRLSGEGIHATFDTINSGGTAGYYEFIVNGSTIGKGLTVSANYNNRSGYYGFFMQNDDKHADLSLTASPTPTPAPTPEPTPTPRPSGDLGGLVTRNDSLFVPVPVSNLVATPTPKPSREPTAAPTSEPTPTPAPAAGPLSNIYVWLVVALLAILIIAAAILIYLRK